MQTKRQDLFTTVRTEGSILPPDLLQRVAEESAAIGGLSPSDYHLSGEKLSEAINRSWNRLQGAWAAFQTAAAKLAPEDAGTSAVREKWLLPLFQELGFGRLQSTKSIEIQGKTYPVSHLWQNLPIHLVGFRNDLDKRTSGVAGASRSSPHSLVQELLNREDAYLWAVVSNGLRLRVLRDNKSLTRQAFVEFDLQGMMDGQVYPDFKLLWLVCHQSRVEGERPERCWLEKWSQAVIKQGTRALDSLRDGVQRAIEALGRGFLSHPSNRTLRDRLQAGTLGKQDYYRQLLRLIYRLMFLFVAEDRGVLFDAASDSQARDRYTRFYSTQRLRNLASKMRGSPHADMYQALHLVFLKLDQSGARELGLPALGSFLWSANATVDLHGCRLANRDLLDALRELAFTLDGQARRPVDYKNLGSEELGGIYESLLELHPEINTEAGIFSLGIAAGHERKITGSYYTPTSLVNCLLDSALEPVLDAAVKGENHWKDRGQTAETRILSVKICDNACGSGHFLIAAAHRIAKRLASARSGDEEPGPDVYRHALRDVIGHCIYGVDVNPMAVELCKVSLWMEAMEPGKPLSFLDHRIQVGNSLIGATPALLTRGIPDVAFDPIEREDKVLCKTFKMQNKDERMGQMQLFGANRKPWEQLGNLAASIARLDAVSDDTIDGVQLKQRSYEELVKSSTYEAGHLLADAWCAAFVWKKNKDFDYVITEAIFRRIERNPHDIAPWMSVEIRHLATRYGFFHWHLAFPDVFTPRKTDAADELEILGWDGGFDVVLGNPPWVRQELLKPVKQLLVLFLAFTSTADSSVYFLERSVQIARDGGRVALLTPNKWLRATYAEKLRALLRERCRVVLLVDFGHSRTLFPDVDTFPAAIVLEPTAIAVKATDSARFVQAHDEDRERRPLEELIRNHAVMVPHGNLRSDRWQLEGADPSRLLDRLMSTGQSLESLLRRPILSGLKTGFNEAFYVDAAAYDAMLAFAPTSAGLFRRFLRGRDVKRWIPAWNGQWHIIIPSSQNRQWPWSNAVGEKEAEQVFATTYPPVHAHLKQFEEQLRIRQDKGVYWWELRACDYYDEFEQSKVLVQCIAYYSQFALDDTGMYVNNKVIVIPTSDLYLLSVLNSRVVWWVLNRTFQHMKDEGLSVDVQFLRRLPVPVAPNTLRDRIRFSASTLLSAIKVNDQGRIAKAEIQLNELVEQAFELTAEEQKILTASLPPRDPIALAEASGHLGSNDVPPQIRLTKATVDVGRAVVYIILLLRRWGDQLVHRSVLESALVLMLNDAARKALLGQSLSAKQSKHLLSRPRCMTGMDGLLGALDRNGVIEVVTTGERQGVKLGAKAPAADTAPADAAQRAAEAIAVLEKLAIEEVMAGIEETVDAEYVFI